MATPEEFSSDGFVGIDGQIAASYYNPQMVADRVIWPAVNKLWQGGDNWRRKAFIGAHLVAPAREFRDGLPIDMRLEADCLLMRVQGNEDEIIHSATLEIQRHLPDVMRDYLWKSVHHQDPTAFQDVAMEDIVAKRITAYYFDTDNDDWTSEHQMLQDPNGDISCPVVNAMHPEQAIKLDQDGEIDYDLDSEVPVKIRDHDLTDISFAIKALTGSRRHLRAIEEIRACPVMDY